MNTDFRVDGYEAYEKANRTALVAASRRLYLEVSAKYADAFAAATPIRRLEILFRIWREFHRRRKLLEPSSGTMWYATGTGDVATGAEKHGQ